jgi:hypothetical protein
MLDLQDVLGSALDMFGNPVAVERAEQESSQDQQLKSALNDIPI